MKPFVSRSDKPFYAGMILLGGFYVFMVVAMVLANCQYALWDPKVGETAPAGWPQWLLWYLANNPVALALAEPYIQYAVMLSLISCSITTIISIWVAVPIGYLMSRHSFRGKMLLDAVLDIPIVLPPLVVGLCLLILFNFPPFAWIADYVVYEIPSVILAQFMVACAFAVRTMRATFEQISIRQEQVALTLGASRGEAFWNIVLPQARRGMLAAATLAWARSLGEFGPILIFASTKRGVTEVLPSSVFLELQAGRIHAAAAISLIMVLLAVLVLIVTRLLGLGRAAF
ncbi:MAG: ABC transporter permease subunit [Pirellulales bacterium]